MSAITPFLSTDASFNPEAIEAMGAAYERACKSLYDKGQSDIVKEIIARRIIEIAGTGERDPDKLYLRALLTLGLPSTMGGGPKAA